MTQKKMSSMHDVAIEIPKEKIKLDGILAIPEKAKVIVVFAHGSGSSRHSKRNQFVANILLEQGIGILLMDLLTQQEEQVDLTTAEHRFNIPLLAKRLVFATEWLKANPETSHLKIGYFGSSTGAAAALIAAAHDSKIVAVVSRGGRADLAKAVIHLVKSPTLFLVGGYDFEVTELNKEAYNMLTAEKKLEIIPGATHLFEEPGALEQVAKLAASWFKKHE